MDNGEEILNKEKEWWNILMELFIVDSGKMDKEMEVE
jgi:hypothetical protein